MSSSDYDDEALKALADLEYEDWELEFDVDKYQKFMDRAGGEREKQAHTGRDKAPTVDEEEDGEEEDGDGEGDGEGEGEVVVVVRKRGEIALPERYSRRTSRTSRLPI